MAHKGKIYVNLDLIEKIYNSNSVQGVVKNIVGGLQNNFIGADFYYTMIGNNIHIYDDSYTNNEINFKDIYQFKVYKKDSILFNYSLQSNYPPQFKEMLQNYVHYNLYDNEKTLVTLKNIYKKSGVKLDKVEQDLIITNKYKLLNKA